MDASQAQIDRGAASLAAGLEPSAVNGRKLSTPGMLFTWRPGSDTVTLDLKALAFVVLVGAGETSAPTERLAATAAALGEAVSKAALSANGASYETPEYLMTIHPSSEPVVLDLKATVAAMLVAT